MLLIYPPAAKPCEPPAGIPLLAGALRGNGLPCTLLDANLEGMLFLLGSTAEPDDTWGRRARRGLEKIWQDSAAKASMPIGTATGGQRRM